MTATASIKPNALHHLALSTGDIKSQIDYFTDVLGMELMALYWMHGAEKTVHGFLKLNDKCAVAFVQTCRTSPARCSTSRSTWIPSLIF